MKKTINKEIGTKYTKWNVVWAVLLVFSFSATSGIVSGHGIDSTKNTDINTDPQNETIKDKESQKIIVENTVDKQVSSDEPDQKLKFIDNSDRKTKVNEDSDTQTNSKENEQRSSDETNKIVKENRESKKESNHVIEDQVKNKDNSVKVSIVNNDKRCQKNIEKNLERKQESCILATNKENTSDNPENTTRKFYNTIVTETEKLSFDINSGVSNWLKMKLIQAQHSGSVSSFYTTSDKIEFQYKSPENQTKDQKVNIYFVMEQNQSFPEKTVMGIIDENNFNLDDVINKDTKSYIQTPVTLSEDGTMLEPLIFGPLPAGSYWILVTPAENKTTSFGSEKKILSVNYFKVLKYEMDAKTPNSIKAGDNFEINLTLNNSSAQEDYTYWATLRKESQQGANVTTNSNAQTQDKFENFMKELSIIQDFSLNSTYCDSSSSKQELQNEINTLQGVNNCTISIGKENQSTLSLSSSSLSPGNYSLFAGAYEKGNGFVGITQKSITIV